MRALLLILVATIAINAHAYENVFYCTYQIGECTKNSALVRVDEAEMEELLERVGAMKENFIGFIDTDGTVFQFFVDNVDNIWVEIPIPAKKGSFGKQIKKVEMQSIIRNLEPPYIAYKKRLSLTFGAW